MNRLIVASISAIAAGVIGCAASGATSWGPVPGAASAAPATSQVPSGSPVPGGGQPTEVWFALEARRPTEQGGSISEPRLFRTLRPEASTSPSAERALDALMAGPSPEEAAAGVFSSLPAGTQVRALHVADGTADLDLDRSFLADADRSLLRLRVAQLVYTLTQSPTVERVRVEVEGGPIAAAGDAADPDLDRPLRRRDLEDLLPAILVERPLIGERVSGRVTVAGTADVFEATVSLRLLDASGRELVRTFTTATCGTGCRGAFSRRIRFEVDVEQPGTLEVFEASALDGSPSNLVRIPLTLLP